MNILLHIIRVILALGIGWASLWPIFGMVAFTLLAIMGALKGHAMFEILSAILFLIGGWYAWSLGVASLMLWLLRSAQAVLFARLAWLSGTLTLVGLALFGLLEDHPIEYVDMAVRLWLFSFPMWLFLTVLGKPWKFLQRH